MRPSINQYLNGGGPCLLIDQQISPNGRPVKKIDPAELTHSVRADDPAVIAPD
jgi:hypothetical protein